MTQSTTTINTGTYLLAILQEQYNHNKRLADSYSEMVATAVHKDTKKEMQAEYDRFATKASEILCMVIKLDAMEEIKTDHTADLLRNYRVYNRMAQIDC